MLQVIASEFVACATGAGVDGVLGFFRLLVPDSLRPHRNVLPRVPPLLGTSRENAGDDLLLHLDALTVTFSFLVLIFFCLLSSQAFRFLRAVLIPQGCSEVMDLSAWLAYNLVLCIGILSVILFFIPANAGLIVLGIALVVVAALARILSPAQTPKVASKIGADARRAIGAWRKDPASLALTVISLGYFAWVLVVLRWPPVGDITFLHGPVTTYLAYGGYAKVYGQLGFYYPVGFHVFPAALVGALGLYPGEAVFLFGGFVAALVPPVMYRLAKQLGAPSILAVLAFTAAFVVHPSDNLEKWILGPFFNGPYPNLLGLLIVLLIMVLQVDRLDGGLTMARVRAYLQPALLYSLVLLFVYPSFAFLVFLHFALLLIAGLIVGGRAGVRDVFERVRAHRALLVIALLAMAVLGIVLALPSSRLDLVLRLYFTPPADYAAYALDYTFLFDNPAGILVLVGVPISVGLLLSKRHVGVASFYLMSAGLLFLSLQPALYLVIWPILPSRSVMLLGMAGWPLLLSLILPGLLRVRLWVSRIRRSSGPQPSPRARSIVASGLVIFAVILAAQAFTDPSVTPLNAPQRYGWFSSTPYFNDDFNGLAWLAAHAQPNDLILSDGSFTSRYGLSVGPLNLTNMIPLEYNQTLREASNLVWDNPTNVSYIVQFLKAFNVRYILSTSEWGTYVLVEAHAYEARRYAPDVYASVFDGYSFLMVGYAAGSTRVYTVIQSAL